MKKTVAVVAAALGLALSVPPVAYADDHVPDIGSGYCPGGSGQLTKLSRYCDGQKYGSGAYWRQVAGPHHVGVQADDPIDPGMHCIFDEHGSHIGGLEGAHSAYAAPAGSCG